VTPGATRPPSDAAEIDATHVTEIHRMTRAPLRVERTGQVAGEKSAAAPKAMLDIFQIPVMQSKPGIVPQEVDTEEASGQAEPAVELPRIGKPDGSALSRRSPSPVPVSGQSTAAATDPAVPPTQVTPVVPQYPHTDPATYQDPEYVIPTTAQRDRESVR
jgi:hypothetical protein